MRYFKQIGTTLSESKCFSEFAAKEGMTFAGWARKVLRDEVIKREAQYGRTPEFITSLEKYTDKRPVSEDLSDIIF